MTHPSQAVYEVQTAIRNALKDYPLAWLEPIQEFTGHTREGILHATDVKMAEWIDALKAEARCEPIAELQAKGIDVAALMET